MCSIQLSNCRHTFLRRYVVLRQVRWPPTCCWRVRGSPTRVWTTPPSAPTGRTCSSCSTRWRCRLMEASSSATSSVCPKRSDCCGEFHSHRPLWQTWTYNTIYLPYIKRFMRYYLSGGRWIHSCHVFSVIHRCDQPGDFLESLKRFSSIILLEI